jgi:hypothetical protein
LLLTEENKLLKKLIAAMTLLCGPVLSYATLSESTVEGEVVIKGVPAFSWYNGCNPTAAGMVIAYWDMRGYSKLIPGNSTTQTSAVNQTIASDEHYNDYALPKDDESTGVLQDKSSLGGEHEDNCLADFLRTSRSSDDLLYGATTSEYCDDGMLAYTMYVNLKNGTAYKANSKLYYHSTTFSFDIFKMQINQNHPMVLVVDVSADGEGDHAVAAVGYRETNGYPEYACWDTWNTETLRWEKFQSIGSGKPWGIYLAFSYEIISEPEPIEPEDPDDPGTPGDIVNTGCTGVGLIVLTSVLLGFGFVSPGRKPCLFSKPRML